MFRPILQAFAYAHKQGIVHRDIKPSNIMAVPTENGMMMRVLDFGIAKVVNPDEAAGTGHTKTSGVPAFSPLYAAPEQIAFGRTGPWTDVHALGLILTEILTDQVPYPATDMQLFEQIISSTRPTPRQRGIDVGAWEPVLRRAVALSPSERWRSASDLLAALEANLGKSEHAAVVITESPSAAIRIGLAPEAKSGPMARQSTGETALEIAGLRAAGRRNRGRLTVIAAVVLLGGSATLLALRSPQEKKQPPDLSSAAPVTPTPRPATRPAPALPVSRSPASSGSASGAPSAPTEPPLKTDKSTSPLPSHEGQTHRANPAKPYAKGATPLPAIQPRSRSGSPTPAGPKRQLIEEL